VSEQLQLPGHCWRCGGTGRVQGAAVVATSHHEGHELGPTSHPTRDLCLLPFEADCPDCSAGTARDRWLAAVNLGRPDGHGRE
jgi:hypothetical protein